MHFRGPQTKTAAQGLPSLHSWVIAITQIRCKGRSRDGLPLSRRAPAPLFGRYYSATAAQRRRTLDIVSGENPHPIQSVAIPRASMRPTVENGIEHPCSESLGGIQIRECLIQLRSPHELLEILRVVLPSFPWHGEPWRKLDSPYAGFQPAPVAQLVAVEVLVRRVDKEVYEVLHARRRPPVMRLDDSAELIGDGVRNWVDAIVEDGNPLDLDPVRRRQQLWLPAGKSGRLQGRPTPAGASSRQAGARTSL